MAQHDKASTVHAISLTWNSERRRGTSIWGKLATVGPHASSFVCRSLGLRRGGSLFALSPEIADSVAPSNSDAAGFSPLPVATDFRLGKSPTWQTKFARFLTIAPDWSGPGLSEQETAYFDRQLASIRRAGARPVWLLGPKVKRDSHTAAILRTHVERFKDIPLLNFLRGCGGSEIYQIPYWHDFDHLNAKGADMFSRGLAVRLAALLLR